MDNDKQEPTADSAPDVSAVMAEIRGRVAAEIATHHQSNGQIARKAQSQDGELSNLSHSELLRALNRGHAFALNLNPDSIVTHRAGPFATVLLKIKRKFLISLRDSVLREYFKAEHEFHGTLVRYLNDLVRTVDMQSKVISSLEGRIKELEKR